MRPSRFWPFLPRGILSESFVAARATVVRDALCGGGSIAAARRVGHSTDRSAGATIRLRRRPMHGRASAPTTARSPTFTRNATGPPRVFPLTDDHRDPRAQPGASPRPRSRSAHHARRVRRDAHRRVRRPGRGFAGRRGDDRVARHAGSQRRVGQPGRPGSGRRRGAPGGRAAIGLVRPGPGDRRRRGVHHRLRRPGAALRHRGDARQRGRGRPRRQPAERRSRSASRADPRHRPAGRGPALRG